MAETALGSLPPQTGGALADGTYVLTSHAASASFFQCNCSSRYTLVVSGGSTKFEWYKESSGVTPVVRSSGRIVKAPGSDNRLYLYTDCPTPSGTPTTVDYLTDSTTLTWFDYASNHFDSYVKQP